MIVRMCRSVLRGVAAIAARLAGRPRRRVRVHVVRLLPRPQAGVTRQPLVAPVRSGAARMTADFILRRRSPAPRRPWPGTP